MALRFGRRGGDSRDADELAGYREFVRHMIATCTAAARGELEARIEPVSGSQEFDDLVQRRHAGNRLLDVSDAFVREAGAALTAAAEGASTAGC